MRVGIAGLYCSQCKGMMGTLAESYFTLRDIEIDENH